MITDTVERISVDEYYIKMARLVSLRGACVRRQVGCVLVDSRNHVLATGYNGRARGIANCLESPCAGSSMASGTGLESCEAIHAEANALLQCGDVWRIQTAYCTTAPCRECVKLLQNTSCERIVFSDDYPHSEESRDRWEKTPSHTKFRAHRIWEHFPEQHEIFELESPLAACEHREWAPSPRDTGDDNTRFLHCMDCFILKEVYRG